MFDKFKVNILSVKYFKKIYYILFNPKFSYILKRKKNNKKHNILDIGCGGDSPYQTKIIFPFSRYVGLDRDFNYHNSHKSINLIDRKIKHDLNSDIQFLETILENEYFDIIIFNHTIEHTFKGLEILELVTRKLKPEGCIYIEFPSIRSLSLPSIRGTLNFCDDSTHLKLYSIQEVANTLLSNKCNIIKGGRRLNWISIFTLPLRLLMCFIRKKSPAGILWDLFGFADFVFGYKI